MIYIGHKFYILQHIYNINGTFIFYCMQTVNFHKLKIYIRSQIQNFHCQILPQNLPIVKLISRHVINMERKHYMQSIKTIYGIGKY